MHLGAASSHRGRGLGELVRGQTHLPKDKPRFHLPQPFHRKMEEDFGKDSGHDVHPQGWIGVVGFVDA